MNILTSYDIPLFYILNGYLHQSRVGDWVIRFFAEYALFIVVIIFLISLKYIHTTHVERFKTLVLATASVVITHAVIAPIIYIFWQRLRPFAALGIPHLFVVQTYAFPSGHTMFSFVVATVIYFYNKRVAMIVYVLGASIGIARVMAGVHYPLDIIGGAFIGTLTGASVMMIYHIIQKKEKSHGAKITQRT